MSDSKPDQILAEESERPLGEADPLDARIISPILRWNGFMKYLGVERLKLLEPLNSNRGTALRSYETVGG